MSEKATPSVRVKIETELYSGDGRLVRRATADRGDDRDFWVVSTDSGETMTLLPEEFEVVDACQLLLEVRYADGDTCITRFNGTYAEARDYYIGRVFNIGSVGDNLQECIGLRLIDVAK